MRINSYENTRYVFLKEFAIEDSDNYIVKVFDLDEGVFKTLIIPREKFKKIVE